VSILPHPVLTATECNKTRGPTLTGNRIAAIAAMLARGVRKTNYINTLCRQNAASVEAGSSLHVTSTILQSSNQYTFLAKGHNTHSIYFISYRAAAIHSRLSE